MYPKVDKLVRRLVVERDYTIDEKAKTAMLTEEGTHRIEEMTGCGNLNDPENLELNQYVSAASKPTPASNATETTWSKTARLS